MKPCENKDCINYLIESLSGCKGFSIHAIKDCPIYKRLHSDPSLMELCLKRDMDVMDLPSLTRAIDSIQVKINEIIKYINERDAE